MVVNLFSVPVHEFIWPRKKHFIYFFCNIKS